MIERKYLRERVHSVETVRHTLNIRIYYNCSNQLLLRNHQILLDPEKEFARATTKCNKNSIKSYAHELEHQHLRMALVVALHSQSHSIRFMRIWCVNNFDMFTFAVVVTVAYFYLCPLRIRRHISRDRRRRFILNVRCVN